MSYKRYIKIGGKVYGPYEYQSHRDKDGSVKSLYVKKVDSREIKKGLFSFNAKGNEPGNKDAKEFGKFINIPPIFALILLLVVALTFVGVRYGDDIMRFTGFASGENVSFYQDHVGIELSEADNYNWVPVYSGQLSSVGISGSVKILDRGFVKVYLGDDLIFDSSRTDELKNDSSRGSFLTGFVLRGDESSEPSRRPSPSKGGGSSSGAGSGSGGSGGGSDKNKSKNNESNQSVPGNFTANFTLDNFSIGNETNITLENLSNFTLGNETNIALENQTEDYDNDSNLTYMVFEFSNICLDTCELDQFNLTNQSYELRFEIENATVFFDSISYALVKDENAGNLTEDNTTHLVLLKEIPNQTLLVNSTTALVLTNYFSGENLSFDFSVLENEGLVGLGIDGDSLSIESSDEVGMERVVVYAFDGNSTIYSNPFEIEVVEEENKTNFTEETIQGQAIIGQPVKWSKKITIDNPDAKEIKISLPKEAENINAEKLSSERGEIKEENIIEDNKDIPGDEIKIIEKEDAKEVFIDVTSKRYGINYETPAPESFEENISRFNKRVLISGPDELNYTNISAYSKLPYEISNEASEKAYLYHITENGREKVEFTLQDTDENGFYDQISWIVPHLSNQTYEIIIITRAEHLDENYTFISDIYNETYQLDGIWSEPIYHYQYVRVTFEVNLTPEKDITLYVRNNESSNTKVEVYYFNSSEKITEFPVITSEGHYKVLLGDMQGEQDTFDLKIVNLDDNAQTYLEFDYIVDPTSPVAVQGTSPVGYYNDSDGSVTFDMKCYDDTAVSMIQLWTNTTGTWQANYSNSSYTNNTWLNITVPGIPDGQNYKWAVWCNDTAGSTNMTENRTFNVAVPTTSIGWCGTLNSTGTTYVLNTSVSSASTCFNITAQNVTLDCNGFNINHSSTTAGYGVWTNSTNIIIKNCNINETNSALVSAYGVYFYNANNGSVINSTITSPYTTTSNRYLYGIKITGNYTTIFNNTILTQSSGSRGIHIDGWRNNISNNLITITRGTTYILELNTGSYNSISNNVAFHSGSNGYGIRISSDNNLVSNNNITGTGLNGNGIHLVTASNNTILNNNVSTTSSAEYGIYLLSSSNNSLINNTIKTDGSSSFGLYFDSATNNTLTGNKINTSSSVAIFVTGTKVEHYNKSIDSSNLVEGLPVNYTFNTQNAVFDNIVSGVYGQVICAWCTNVAYNNCSLNKNGFAFYNTSNSMINNSIVYTTTGYGVIDSNGNSAFLENNTFNLMNITTTSANDYLYGIYFLTAGGNRITNSNIITGGVSGHGVYVSSSNYVNMTSNNIHTQNTGAIGIYVSASDLNNLVHNTVTTDGSTTAYGVYLATSNNDSVENNTITTSGPTSGYGLYLTLANYNRIINNTFYLASSAPALYVLASIGSNKLEYNVIERNTVVTGRYLAYLKTNAATNAFNYNNFNSNYAPNQRIYFTGLGYATGNTFTNDVFNYSTYDMTVNGINNFTNCTFNNLITTTGENNVFWYADAYVNDTAGSPLNNANISVYNNIGTLANTSLTNVLGLTPRLTLREYMQNSTAMYFDTNYTFNASYTGVTDIKQINLTQSKVVPNPVFITLNLGGDTIILSYAYPTPNNGSRQIANSVTINVSVNGTNNIDTCLLSWDSGGGYVNETMTKEGSGTSVFCSKTKSTVDGTTYWYQAYANDTSGNVNSTDARTFRENAKPDILVLSSPADLNHTTNRTPEFSWTGLSDSEGDTITTELNITPNCASSTCDFADIKLKNITNNGTSYTLTQGEKFKNLYSAGDYSDNYTWKVIAWDGYEWSSTWSSSRTIFIDSEVMLTLINNTVNFGSMINGQQNDTTTDNPYPLLLQNDGNCYADVNLSSIDLLWDAIDAPSDYYVFKIDKYLTWSSFNWSSSQTTWAQIPVSNATTIRQLNYTSGNNRSEMDINVTVPSNESAGVKSSIVTLTGYYIHDPE